MQASQSILYGDTQTDVLIIGGGLAGLAAAILLARVGHKVVVVERHAYPFHRVCGEYISLESWPFLEDLGIPLSDMNLPIIKQLRVTDVAGRAVATKLPLGGFGISRYQLDYLLAKQAQAVGVTIVQGTVQQVMLPEVADGLHQVLTDQGVFSARLVLGAFGKRSNLDVAMKRPFVQAASDNRSPYHNYIGVKWHLDADLPLDLIELHNFQDGYAGISAVEGGATCFCYLTTAQNLRKAGSIEAMEQAILSQNPVLKRYLTTFNKRWESPQTIAQVSFAPKAPVEQGIWMLGDSAGLIAPLCGNGMSMALHAAAIAAPLAHQYLTGEVPWHEAEQKYAAAWRTHFSTRLWVGRNIQAMFGNPLMTAMAVGLFRLMPPALAPLIKLTHGKPFVAEWSGR